MNQNTIERSILVTGAAGFIGSTFANLMVSRYPNDRFVLLDALTPIADINNLETATRESPNYVFEKANIRDRAALERVFDMYAITDIINFAAETHVDVSIVRPQDFIETNIVGTHNLLQLARARGIQRFHQISTDEVYGALGEHDPAFTEETPLDPRNPYSASKASADLLVLAYHRTFGLDTTITRSSNNYGPRQDVTKLIPLFITHLLSGKRVPLYGDGRNIRDWLFVEENAEAIDIVFRNGVSGNVYNIGGNCEHSNSEIAEMLLELTGKDARSIEHVADRLGHDFRYAINGTKMKDQFNWQARLPLEEGLRRTVYYFEQKPRE